MLWSALSVVVLCGRAWAAEPPSLSTAAVHISSQTVLISSQTVAVSTQPPAPELLPGTAHLAVFKHPHFVLTMPFVDPFERLLRESATEFALLRVENIVSHFNGGMYMYQVPASVDTLGPEPALESLTVSTSTVQVLETSGGFFALIPPNQEVMERFLAAAQDPASYEVPMRPEIKRREADFTRTSVPYGDSIHSLNIRDLEAKSYPQWRNGFGFIYKFRYRGAELEALFLFKTLGGNGRIAAAVKMLKQKYGSSLLVLNRGEIFMSLEASPGALLRQVERMGADVSVPDAGALDRFPELLKYRREHPDGIQFLCANLVYSTAAAQTVLAPYKMFSVAGLRLAVLGLSDPDWQRSLRAPYAKDLKLIDPVAAAQRQVQALRGRADLVVALSNLPDSENVRLQDSVRGLDLVVGNELPVFHRGALGTAQAFDPDRSPYDKALFISGDGSIALTHLEVQHKALAGDRYALSVRQEHLVLDERFPDEEGYPDFDAAAYGIVADTRPPVLPSARSLYPGKGSFDLTRDFWNLAGSLAAQETQSEAAFLPIHAISVMTAGAFTEEMVRKWFRWEEQLVTFELPGRDLQDLLKTVHDQADKEKAGHALAVGQLPIAVGGMGEGDAIHGNPIDPNAVYKVVGTERLMAQASQYPPLAKAKNVRPAGPLDQVVLGALRRYAQEHWAAERYRPLLDGRPVGERGLWTINFRDIGMRVSDTKVVRDPDAFARVPSPRVQGFDELLIGGVTKIDADYYLSPYRWSNSLEAEYSRSRLTPPNQPSVINIPSNRISLLTTGTKRLGSFPWGWMAQSYGPSLGFQYEGEVERTPGLRRKNIYSLYPGFEFFNGRFFRSISFSADLKRDVSRDSANNQYGFRERALFSSRVGADTMEGELWAKYFVRGQEDSDQDLLWEGDFNIKLQIPVLGHFTIGPFFDFYFFALKIRPLSGYSAISGVTVSFTRLWKPQYEKF